MSIKRFIILLAATQCHGAEVQDDLLSFTNGDQLHGHLSGIAAGPSILWKRDDVGEEVKFKSSELRRIVLRGGRPLKPLDSLSHIGTANGDRIPGIVREIDDKRVLLETGFGGMLEIPRDQVGLLAPNPLGGRVLYQGPFTADEWTMATSEHPDGLPAPQDNVGKAEKIPQWKFSGSAWYWQNQEIGTALVRKAGMPDRSILKFDIAWKSRLSLAVAFHADFKRPAQGEAEEDKQNVPDRSNNISTLPGIFGGSYVLHLYSNYVMLHRTTFDEDGRPQLERVQTSNSSLRLGDSGNTSVEIRCNRFSGEITLFVDGEFVVQWSELGKGLDEVGGYAGKGDGFGFLVQADDSPVRISEVIVAEWNGMPDAARSLQVDDADIVLLSNGTDRFSGKVTGLHDGNLKLEGRFGDFEFPLNEIAEVRFAKSGIAEVAADASDEIKVRLYPLGKVSGRPLSGDRTKLHILNGAAGKIDINLDNAVMLEFQGTESFLDDWDAEF
jgi:hypothetical protein